MKRTLWMFPRCKRTAGATEVGLMLRALSNALHDSPNNTLDQITQDKLIETFNQFELKEGGKLLHFSSGGARTYFAYLKQLGFLFERQNADKTKSTFLTIAGEDIADLNNPASIVRKQILRMQFPSPYSIGNQVDIDESVTVKPAIFVARMLEDKNIGGFVSNEDIALACIYGTNISRLKLVVSKCINARKLAASSKNLPNEKKRLQSLLDVVDTPNIDLYTKKTFKNINKPNFYTRQIKEVIDIANTLINRLVSAGILLRDVSQKSVFESTRYYLNKNFQNEIDAIASEPIERRANYSNLEGWQRRLGRGNREKDLRQNCKCRKFLLAAPHEIIKQETLKKIKIFGSLFDIKKFCEDLCKKTNKSFAEVEAIVVSVLPNSKGDIESQLISTASDSKRHVDFEINLASYLKSSYINADVIHIGNRIRKNKNQTQHNFADILFHTAGHQIIQIDAKATSKLGGYEYNASEMSKSEDYATITDELFLHTNDEQKCFAIISSRFSVKSYSRAYKSSARTKIPFKLVNIRDLIDIVDKTSPKEQLFINEIENYLPTPIP